MNGCTQCIHEEADLNCDTDINILDLSMVTSEFGKTSGFDPILDMDKNGEIDIYDLVFVAGRFT
ncbi:MAG: hypothetical protein JSW41_02970 [Candidatus Aenigmatarchaeota archaeon]|nr:MAG: hypothetical protein JSW41_02970 [Candidatus Aenigmarchaeota archaeon]